MDVHQFGKQGKLVGDKVIVDSHDATKIVNEGITLSVRKKKGMKEEKRRKINDERRMMESERREG
jgi:hypothetical protein